MNIHTTHGRKNIKTLYFSFPVIIIFIIFYTHVQFIPYFLGNIFVDVNWLKNIIIYFKTIEVIYTNIFSIRELTQLQNLPKNEIAYFLFQFLTLIICTIPLSTNPIRKLYEKLKHHQTAKFANVDTIFDAKMEENGDQGIILGKLNSKNIVLKETMGILIVAPPGTGKTQTLIRMLFKAKKNSMVVLDIKRELFEMTSKERGKFSKVLKIEFDPDAKSISWNPFENIPENLEKRETYVDRIAELLFTGGGKQAKSDFFLDSGKQLFQSIAKAKVELLGSTTISDIISEIQITNEIIEQKNLTNDERNYSAIAISNLASKIQKLLDNTQNEITKKYYTKIISLLEEIAGLPNETFGGVLQTFNTKTKIFTQETIKRITSGDSFDFNCLRGIDNMPVTLYIIIKQEDVETFAPLVRLFFEMLTLFFLSKDKNEATKGYPITLAIDEYTRHGKLDKISNLSQLSRSMRLQPIIITQSISQMNDLYGKDTTENIFANSFAKIFFTLNEQSLTKKLSSMLGTYQVEEAEKQIGSFFDKSPRRVTSKAVPLLNEQDIMSIETTKQLLVIQGFVNKPFFIDRLALYGTKEEKKIGEIDEKDIYYKIEDKNIKTHITNEEYIETKDDVLNDIVLVEKKNDHPDEDDLRENSFLVEEDFYVGEDDEDETKNSNDEDFEEEENNNDKNDEDTTGGIEQDRLNNNKKK